MPRNSSGVYQLPAGNPVVSGTLIESVWANATMSDLAQAMTESLDRFGRSTMAAPMLLNDGTVSAPGLAFGPESSTGLFRKSAKVLGVAVGGQEVATFTQSGAAFAGGIAGDVAFSGNPSFAGNVTVTGNASVTGNATIGGTATITGAVTASAGITYPDDKGITWGDGSTALVGNATTDILSMTGKLFDTAGGIRARGAVAIDATKSAVTIGTNGFTTPGLQWIKSDGATDAKVWDTIVDSASSWTLRAVTDSLGSAINVLAFTRTGAVPQAASVGIPLGIGTLPAAGFMLDLRSSATGSIFRWSSSANAGIQGTAGTAADNAWINADGAVLALRQAGTEIARTTPAGLQLSNASSAWITHNGTAGVVGIIGSAGVADGHARLEIYDDSASSQPKAAILYGNTVQFRNSSSTTEYGRFDANGALCVGLTTATPVSGYTSIAVNGANGSLCQIYQGGTKVGHLFGNSAGMGIDTAGAGIPVTLYVNGAQKFQATSTALLDQINGQEIGWRNIPLNGQNGYYYCASADRGKCVVQNAAAGVDFNSGFTFGDVISIMNRSGGNIGIFSTNITMYWGTGTPLTGNRVLAHNGVATIIFIGANVGVLTGSGLS